MKIEKYNAGALTNFEVLQFLKSRGASKDPSRILAPIAPSEFKVYDYLVETAACDQTKEIIEEFLEKCKPYGLAKGEILNIINIRPDSLALIYPLLEKADNRTSEEGHLGEGRLEDLVEMIVEVLPEPPYAEVADADEEVAEEGDGDEEIADEGDADEEIAEEADADEEIAEEADAVEDIATEEQRETWHLLADEES